MEHFEVVVLIAVVLVQVAVTFFAWRNTRSLAALVPAAGAVSLIEPSEDSEQSPAIAVRDPSPTFARVVADLNAYAANKGGTASDFAIVKDVVDRPIDTAIAQAESRVSIPLYIGLAGALFGIIVGVASLSTLGSTDAVEPVTEEAIDSAATAASFTALTDNLNSLLNAVSWAMGASLAGVILTVLLGWATRSATSEADERRDAFLAFYQKEFLPQVTRDVNSVLASLNATLNRFNEEFGGNVVALQDSFRQNTVAISEQADVLRAMRELSMGGALEGTVKLYKDLATSAKHLEKLNPHIERSYQMFGAVNEAVTQFVREAGSVSKVASMADNLERITSASNEIQLFVGRHLDELETGSVNAQGLGQRVVESFNENQAALQQQLTDVTGSIRALAESVQTVTQRVAEESAEAIDKFPSQLDSRLDTAFDSGVVQRIEGSAQAAADAADSAATELARNQNLRQEMVSAASQQNQALGQVVQALETLSAKQAADADEIRARMNRPWYKKVFS